MRNLPVTRGQAVVVARNTGFPHYLQLDSLDLEGRKELGFTSLSTA